MATFGKMPVLGALLSGVVLATAIPTEANDEISASLHEVTVKVERRKPEREKHPTLHFLRANRAFIRAQLDRLRVRPLETDASADALSPSHVRHQEMMAAIASATDALAAERASFDDHDLLARIDDLARIDAQLGRLDALLAEQRARLAEIEAHFVDAQTTALMLIVRGLPDGTVPTQMVVVDDGGAVTRVDVPDGARASLENGGLMEVYHEYAEPREQSWRVSFVSAGGVESDPRYVTLRPEAGRLTFVELDLTTWADESALVARAWLDAPLGAAEAVAERPAAEERRP